MNQDDKADLRDLRDSTADTDDKKLLRKTLNYIHALEAKLFAVRVHAKSIITEASNKQNSTEED
jgi:hypothetical protein